MKLYEIPNNSKILLPISDGAGFLGNQLCEFKHVDGAYSLIITLNDEAVHLSASAEVEKVGDHYELSDE